MFTSISRIVEESNILFGPPLQLSFLDNGKTGDDAGFLAGSMSMSNREPLLWSLPRLRSRLSFSEMIDNMGPREGRHADRDGEGQGISLRLFWTRANR